MTDVHWPATHQQVDHVSRLTDSTRHFYDWWVSRLCALATQCGKQAIGALTTQFVTLHSAASSYNSVPQSKMSNSELTQMKIPEQLEQVADTQQQTTHPSQPAASSLVHASSSNLLPEPVTTRLSGFLEALIAAKFSPVPGCITGNTMETK